MKRVYAVILLAMFMVLASCSPRAERDERVLRIAVSIEPESLTPMAMNSADVIAMFDNVYDALLSYDELGNLLPSLAQEWVAMAGNQRYLVRLREDVRFHNGQPLCAYDVEHSFQLHQDFSAKLANVVDVVVLDEYNLEFVLATADSDFGATLATTWIFSASEGAEPQSGTGVYQFVRYEEGRSLLLERFDDSFHHLGGDLSFFEQVEFIIIKESASVLMGLQSGAIDVAAQVDISTLDQTMRERFSLVIGPQNLTNLMAFNHDQAPFDQLVVRQAINHAVDKDALIRLLVDGYGSRIDTGLSPVLNTFYNHDLENFYAYDPLLAKELLASVGYDEANALSFTIKVPSNYAMHLRTAEIIALQLAQVGIKVAIEPIEWATWLSEVYRGGGYQATIVGLTGKLSAYQQLVRYSSRSQTNFTAFENDAFEQALTNALLAVGLEEQIAYYKEAQRILVQEANSLFLLDPNLAIVTQPRIIGVQNYPLRTFRVREYRLA